MSQQPRGNKPQEWLPRHDALPQTRLCREMLEEASASFAEMKVGAPAAAAESSSHAPSTPARAPAGAQQASPPRTAATVAASPAAMPHPGDLRRPPSGGPPWHLQQSVRKVGHGEHSPATAAPALQQQIQPIDTAADVIVPPGEYGAVLPGNVWPGMLQDAADTSARDTSLHADSHSATASTPPVSDPGSSPVAASSTADPATAAQSLPLACPLTGVPYELHGDGHALPVLLACGHDLSAGAAAPAQQDADVGGAAALTPHSDLPATVHCPRCSAEVEHASVQPHPIIMAALRPRGAPHGWLAAALDLAVSPAALPTQRQLLVKSAPHITVQSAQHAEQAVAIKSFADLVDEENAAFAAWEVAMLAQLQCSVPGPGVAVRMLGWACDGASCCIVMPRLHASLDAAMQALQQGAGVQQADALALRMPEEQAVSVAFSVAEKLHALHSRGIVHGFVCPGNVLVHSHSDEAVLCGFTHSAVMVAGRPAQMAAEAVDDSEWCALELLDAAEADGGATAKAVSPQADVWGLASLVLYLVTGALLACFRVQAFISVACVLLSASALPH